MLFDPLQHHAPPTTLAECLPALVKRLEQRAVNEMHDAVGRIRVDREAIEASLEAPHFGLEKQFELWRQLCRAIDAELERLDTIANDYHRFSAEYFGRLPGQSRDSMLISRLDDEATSRWAAWLDRRAVRSGLLNFDAYHERHIGRVSRIVSRARVGLLGLEELGADMLKRLGPVDGDWLARRILADDAVLYELAQHGELPELRWLALRAASAPLQRLFGATEGAVPNQWLNLAIRTAISPHATVWAQRTALDTLAAARNAGEVFEGRLRRSSLPRDDWFVRAHAARKIATCDPERALGVFDELVDDETSDEVRIAVADGLGRLGSTDALRLLERLSKPEERPKVRFAAARALAKASVSGGEIGAEASVALVEQVLSEPDDVVFDLLRQMLLEVVAAGMIRDQEATRGVALALRSALATRLAAEADFATADRIARLRLELADLAAYADADPVEDQLRRLRFGATLQLQPGLSKPALSRMMARAARDGYGLYARETPKGWRVRRGERFRPRLWRLLHEWRHPSPSKRQAYTHLRGRHFGGSLRAHPVHLGELTPTTVPGERRQVGAEGGWGPYLPLIDDLLAAQWHRAPIEITTVAGITRIVPERSLKRRLAAFLRLSWQYRELDDLRLSSLQGTDEQQRSSYLGTVREKFGTRVQFQAHFDEDPAPPGIRMLVARAHQEPLLGSGPSPPPRPPPLPPPMPGSGSGSSPPPLPKRSAMLVAVPVLQQVNDLAESAFGLASRLSTDVFERGGVRIQDLGVVMVFLVATFVARMFWVRVSLEHWRREVPLCIGGWGTRGKSGTERLKAGLFAGLGSDVFVKTTGCEAMFIHSPRRLEPVEIFIYRPYDKASIWEQRDLLRLSRNLGSDVFLWECMALTPRYVEILQWYWMRDDLVTLTNAYPDHEDIQGPAGVDVAETIARFIRPGGQAITSEREMLPVFQRIAHERGAELDVVGPDAEMAISDDMLDRFPYREHPRNIALVARMAERLGIDRDFAIFAMADHVVPDLGVLKEYPAVRLLGREVRFVNGCSANERAGFMNNWVRMELDEVGSDTSSRTQVLTVVNNRADRVSRSIVFADILVRDVTVDRHVLIGTNLSGLRNYLSASLARYLRTISIVEADTSDLPAARRRLDTFLARVRVRPEAASSLLTHLGAMAAACDVVWQAADGDAEGLQAELTGAIGPRTWSEHLEVVRKLPTVDRLLGAIRKAETPTEALARAETDDQAALHRLSAGRVEDLGEFWVERIACTLAYHSQVEQLKAVIAGGLSADDFHVQLHSVWQGRFWHTVVSVEESDISGDGIIVRATRAVPPGFEGVLMGTQNIKQTGLDFVYRWVDLDTTMRRLDALPDAGEALFRSELTWLLGREGLHLTEALATWRHLQALPRLRKCSPREVALIGRAAAHVAQFATKTFDALATGADGAGEAAPRRERVLAKLEHLLDPLDAVWRRYRAEQLMRMLAAKRISHLRMAELMRDLTARQKGGWLGRRRTH